MAATAEGEGWSEWIARPELFIRGFASQQLISVSPNDGVWTLQSKNASALLHCTAHAPVRPWRQGLRVLRISRKSVASVDDPFGSSKG